MLVPRLHYRLLALCPAAYWPCAELAQGARGPAELGTRRGPQQMHTHARSPFLPPSISFSFSIQLMRALDLTLARSLLARALSQFHYIIDILLKSCPVLEDLTLIHGEKRL